MEEWRTLVLAAGLETVDGCVLRDRDDPENQGQDREGHAGDGDPAADSMPVVVARDVARDDAVPVLLGDGGARPEAIELAAGERCARRYLLDGHERVAWRCRVVDGLDVVLSARLARARVAKAGLREDEGCTRELSEKERASSFSGYADLAGDHAELRSGLQGPGGGALLLVLELDNSFSYLTAKRVELELTKLDSGGASCAGKGGGSAGEAPHVVTVGGPAPRAGGLHSWSLRPPPPAVDVRARPRGGVPMDLAQGVATLEKFRVFAAVRCIRSYSLEGRERIAWRCRVLGGYDIGVAARVESATAVARGFRADEERGREVGRWRRAPEVNGYCDLSREHAGLLRAAGRAPVLTLEFDNSYSYFTPKSIELELAKS